MNDGYGEVVADQLRYAAVRPGPCMSIIHTSFIPSNAVGGRAKNEHAPITVHVGADGDVHDTNLHVNSSVRISPRKTFTQWLAAVRAVSGQTARLHRVSERQHRREYLG